MTFPAGNYIAFRINIGNASGHNWWGLLYPPLFSDDEDEDDYLKNSISQSEYEYISNDSAKNEDNREFTFRFKIFTFLNDIF